MGSILGPGSAPQRSHEVPGGTHEMAQVLGKRRVGKGHLMMLPQSAAGCSGKLTADWPSKRTIGWHPTSKR